MTERKCSVYRFSDVEVHEGDFRLKRAGETLTVEPKVFRVLLYLLRNPGRLISKSELLNAGWGDTAVTENSLTRNIALLRRLLGDDIRNPRYIETVATVGYRFVPKVEVSNDTSGGLQATAKATDLSEADIARTLANGEIAEAAANSEAQIETLGGDIEKRGEPVSGLNRRAFVWTAVPLRFSGPKSSRDSRTSPSASSYRAG